MAAPINFGQLQGQVLSAIWLLDLLGAPDSKKKMLGELKEILSQTQTEKAELDLGRNLKTSLALLHQEIEKAKGEADKIVSVAKTEAEKIIETATKTQKGLDQRSAKLNEIDAEIGKRQAELDRAFADLDKQNKMLAAREAKLSDLGETLNRRAEQVKIDRERLDNALSEFRNKMG